MLLIFLSLTVGFISRLLLNSSCLVVYLQLQMVVVIFPTKRDDRYNAVKKLCCLECPIPSQVLILIHHWSISLPLVMHKAFSTVGLEHSSVFHSGSQAFVCFLGFFFISPCWYDLLCDVAKLILLTALLFRNASFSSLRSVLTREPLVIRRSFALSHRRSLCRLVPCHYVVGKCLSFSGCCQELSFESMLTRAVENPTTLLLSGMITCYVLWVGI